jgi:hypothetical protein
MQDDFGLSCACGSEDFERVVVRRRGRSDYVTEFVACVVCKVMFHAPAVKPADDGGASLKRDAAVAALDYRKPGRHKPPRRR